MLWHKSWLETRWRFLIGLALITCSAAAVVFAYPHLVELLPLAQAPQLGGELGRRIQESVQVMSEYHGYVWSQWFGKQLDQMWLLFAVLLGTGGLVVQTVRGGALFTLSLPVSRQRLVFVRAALALGELAVLAIVPSLALVALSPAIGQSYGVSDALVHSACLVVGGAGFFGLASLLSTVFSDVWRPALIALLIAVVLASLEYAVGAPRFGVFEVMSAESYFRGNGVPWLGLAASAVATSAMLVGAARNIARQDF